MKPFALFLCTFLSSYLYAGELWLTVGETREIPAGRTVAVRVGSRGVVKVIDGERAVRVIGIKPGGTSLVIGDTSYFVRVSFGAQKEFLLEMRRQVARMMGVKLNTSSHPAEVTGTLLRFSDWLTLAETARRWRGEYVFRARALPDVAEAAINHLQSVARRRGFPVIRFAAVPEFTAQLPLGAKGLKTSAEESLRPYGIRVDMSGADLALQPLIRTRVILAEISRESSREFGIGWPSSYEANLLPKPPSFDSLSVVLKALEAKGEAQVLASPTLVCKSGGQASFHAGGEFPIRTAGRRVQNVTWKPHGVILNVKPKADFQGAISLEIETQVSLLDMAAAVDGIPALKTNSVKSHFDLPGRRTIALSGLLREESGGTRQGLPRLGGLPVLGPLFSSRNFRNHRSELVVFVTPEIFTPDEDGGVKLPEGWVKDEP